MKNIENTITLGTNNVFADLGLPDAEELLAKANLALHIRRTVESRGLTQSEAAALMSLDQPKVSSIVNGRLDGFSTERLMRFLNDLGCDIQISVSASHPETRGHLLFRDSMHPRKARAYARAAPQAKARKSAAK
jgi:predicted XRE-type DNA-binding protein